MASQEGLRGSGVEGTSPQVLVLVPALRLGQQVVAQTQVLSSWSPSSINASETKGWARKVLTWEERSSGGTSPAPCTTDRTHSCKTRGN